MFLFKSAVSLQRYKRNFFSNLGEVSCKVKNLAVCESLKLNVEVVTS